MELTLETQEEERKPVTTLVAKAVQRGSIANVVDFSRHCRFHKVVRVTAWVSRFVNNARSQVKGKTKMMGDLEVSELDNGEEQWIRIAQKELREQENFQQLVSELGIEEIQGVLRCHGRLINSSLDFETIGPLSSCQRITD